MLYRLLIIFIFSIANAQAITLTQTVQADITIDLNTVTPTDAGDYFARSQPGPENETLLSIGDISNGTKWQVYARLKTEIPGLTVKIKRTGNGTGIHKPSGNKNNRKLIISERPLFSGKGSISNIPMQATVAKIGVKDGHGTFESEIEFIVKTN